jgi:alpha-glucosidase (family GH31 glycosyl hydrolase)
LSEKEVNNNKIEVLGFSGRLLFVLVVILNVVTIYRQNYTPFSQFINFESILAGAKASPVIWVTYCAGALSLILTGILIMKAIPKSGKRPRYLSALVGLPLLLITNTAIEYFVFNMANSWAGQTSMNSYIFGVLISAFLCAVSISLLLSLATCEGSGAMLKSIVPLLVRYLAPSLLLGGIVYMAKTITIAFYIFPVIGFPLRAGIDLLLVIWFFKTASRMINHDKETNAHLKYSGGTLLFNRLLLLLSLSLTTGIAGLSIMVHGPTPHLNAVLPDSIVLKEKKVPIARWELRGDKVIASSKWLSLIVGKDPFDFAVKDADNKILLQLYIDKNASGDYRGVSINREYRAVRELPFADTGSLVKSRFQVWSSPLKKADAIRKENQEIVVESRLGYRPVAVAFSFYDEDILKINVEPGPRSYSKTTSITFYCGEKEGIFGIGGHEGNIDQRGQDIELVTGPLIKDKNEFSVKSFGFWGERASFSIGPGTNNYPVPFVYFARGVGVFMAETQDPRIEAGSRYPKAVRFSGRGGPLTLYLIAGATPDQVFKRYGEITGKGPVPPKSVISPWTVLPENIDISNPKTSLDFLKNVRQSGLSIENIFIRKKSLGNLLDIENTNKTNCKEKISQLSTLGFKAYFEDSIWLEKGTPDYLHALKNEYLIKNRLGLPYHSVTSNGIMAMVDLTNPAALKWKEKTWKRLKDSGFSGGSPDPACFVAPETILFNGESGWVMRNSYPLLYAQKMKESLGEDSVIISQVGYSGIENFSSVFLHKDNDGKTNTLNKAVGMSISGAPVSILNWDNLYGESATGDLQKPGISSITPSMLIPVDEFLKPGTNDEMNELVSFMAEVSNNHTKLFPLYYSLALHKAQNGAPEISHPALIWTDDPKWKTIDGQFIIGDALMMAVPKQNAKKKLVLFPPGKWVHLETQTLYESESAEIPVYRGRPMAFLGEGQILPVSMELFHTTEKTSLENVITGPVDNNMVLVWIVGKEGALTLYDGTSFSASQVANTIIIRTTGNNDRYLNWRIHACPTVRAIYINQLVLPKTNWEYRNSTKTLSITDISGEESEIEILFSLTED